MAKKSDTQSGRFTQQDAIDLALMAKDIADIKAKTDSINNTLNNDFVRKVEFNPVKNLVYGFVVLIVIAVIGAILTLVIIHPGEPTQVVTSIPTDTSK